MRERGDVEEKVREGGEDKTDVRRRGSRKSK